MRTCEGHYHLLNLLLLPEINAQPGGGLQAWRRNGVVVPGVQAVDGVARWRSGQVAERQDGGARGGGAKGWWHRCGEEQQRTRAHMPRCCGALPLLLLAPKASATAEVSSCCCWAPFAAPHTCGAVMAKVPALPSIACLAGNLTVLPQRCGCPGKKPRQTRCSGPELRDGQAGTGQGSDVATAQSSACASREAV